MKKNPTIVFEEDSHSYFHNDKRFTSVNSILSNFGFEFDKEYFAIRKVFSTHIPNFWKRFFGRGFTFKNPPTLDQLINIYEPALEETGRILAEEVVDMLDSWDVKARLGTEFHKEQETQAHELSYIVNPYNGKKYKTQPPPFIPKGFDNASLVEHLKDLPDGVHTEAVVWSLPHEVAGQVDELFIESKGKYRYVDIGDHKTNSKAPKLEKGGFKLKYPVNHLIDCTYTKYWLQVSLYAYCLQLAGFKIRNVGFYHYTDFDVNTKNVFTLKYLEKECKNIFDIYKEFGIK